MKISKTNKVLFLMALLSLLGIQTARAVRPLYSPFVQVAGNQYNPGFQDGSFNTARFYQPLGLSVSGDGTRLFVADSLNCYIRVIHLDQNNEVGTVAGQGLPGDLDGPVTQAQFRDPRGVLYLPGDHLAVNDFATGSIRFVDMKRGMVTTYRGGPVHLDGTDSPNPKTLPTPVPFKGIKDMAYLPSAHSILFTQPEAGVLNMLNLGTGQVTAVLKDNVQLPHPSALWIQEDRIYVADTDLLGVFSMDWKNNAVTKLRLVGTSVDKVLSISISDNQLYALLKKVGYPVEVFPLNRKDDSFEGSVITFSNGWGDTLAADKYSFLVPDSPWVGLVPDPLVKRKFFYSVPNKNIIVSFRQWEPGNIGNKMLSGEYPAEKPKNTYRIMLCGDCRVSDTDDYPFPTNQHPEATGRGVPPYCLSVAPQIERELNLRAALDDNPLNYELINVGHHGDLIFWPTTDVPAMVKKLDVDQVVIFSPKLDGDVWPYYFLFNLNSDGVPMSPPDPEYTVKPPLERIPDGLPRRFYDYCKEHNWVRVNGHNLEFSFDHSDPKIRGMVQEFWEKPWEVLNRKLSNMRTSGGKPVKLLILVGYEGLPNLDYKPKFYGELAQKLNIPCFDVDPYLNTLGLAYFPTHGNGHFTPDGAVFFAKLMAHLLPDKHLIPWPTPEKTPTK